MPRRAPAPNDALSAEIARCLRRWARVWRVPDLPRRLRVEWSPRLRTSLGRCLPAGGVVRLHPVLQDPANRALLREALCHEAAHQVVHARRSGRVAVHGPEWRALLRAAGYAPRVRIAASLVNHLPAPPARRRFLYAHRCLGCGARFVARRTDRRWRCGACRDRGREGAYAVTRTPATAGREPAP